MERFCMLSVIEVCFRRSCVDLGWLGGPENGS